MVPGAMLLLPLSTTSKYLNVVLATPFKAIASALQDELFPPVQELSYIRIPQSEGVAGSLVGEEPGVPPQPGFF
jgi:hypothetical protein